MNKETAISFSAQIFKIQTLVDGGWRLTLDGAGNPEAVLALFQAKQPGILLEVAVVAVMLKPVENFTKLDENEINKKKAKTGAVGGDRGRFVEQRD